MEFCFSQFLIFLLVFLREILKMLSYKFQKKKYYFGSSQKKRSQLTYEAILNFDSNCICVGKISDIVG